MSVATSTAIGIAAAVGTAGSVASSVIGSKAASSAASTQADAANHAADLQKQAADEALAYQKEKDALAQSNAAPWLKAGGGAVTSLSSMLGINPDGTVNPAGGSLLEPWKGSFTAPTEITEQNDPGFQERLKQGQQALERSAAARGTLLSGGTAKAIARYGQDYASNEYGAVYGRKFNEYQQAYNEFEQGQANTYNRLAGLSGTGQVTAQQLNTQGQQSSQNAGNILLGSAGQIGNSLESAAAARASGYVGSANAITGAIGGGANNLVSLLTLLNAGKYQSSPIGATPASGFDNFGGFGAGIGG